MFLEDLYLHACSTMILHKKKDWTANLLLENEILLVKYSHSFIFPFPTCCMRVSCQWSSHLFHLNNNLACSCGWKTSSPAPPAAHQLIRSQQDSMLCTMRPMEQEARACSSCVGDSPHCFSTGSVWRFFSSTPLPSGTRGKVWHANSPGVGGKYATYIGWPHCWHNMEIGWERKSIFSGWNKTSPFQWINNK